VKFAKPAIRRRSRFSGCRNALEMNFNNTTPPTGAMFVKALYDYDADDRTSLSFRQGDVIQVITQLESGKLNLGPF
jgi:hypothetical protein